MRLIDIGFFHVKGLADYINIQGRLVENQKSNHRIIKNLKI